jgi:hypothetical protein
MPTYYQTPRHLLARQLRESRQVAVDALLTKPAGAGAAIERRAARATGGPHEERGRTPCGQGSSPSGGQPTWGVLNGVVEP